jgi:hypothetical protein
MHRTLALAALLFAPVLAAAHAPPTADSTAASSPAPAARPAADASAPQWSLGGGVSYVILRLQSPVGSSLLEPSASASLEHRLSARTWLVVGAYGSVQRFRSDDPAVDSYGIPRNDSRQLALTLGVRRILTRPGAMVQVSLLALGEAGVGDADRRTVYFSGVSTSTDETTWNVGADAGIALDRELTDGLSLRVASPLLGARYSWSVVDATGTARRHSSGFSVDALLAPRLELRLAF